ncbi:helix-turn-helix domain-containing protein [Paenibacillus sp. NPDC058071]|uniref:helix-turn-helix domain-containing protein n=1 Tax=Paenibacillus sp. NPDC058071 TaxID=3346326 RepID=UPI0036D7E107
MIVQVSTPQMELWRIEGPFSNNLHRHDEDFQITVMMDGGCVFTQEDRDYKLAGGDGLVQPPGERHVFGIGEQAGVLIFKVKEKGLKQFVGRDSVELGLRQQFDRTLLAGRMRQWTNGLLAYDTGSRLAQEEIELQVLDYLTGALSGSHKGSGGVKVGGGEPAGSDPYMGQAMDYIHSHYKDPIAIVDLAAIAMRSRFHFIRTFKSLVGTTPYQYVLQLRIDEAKRLLQRTDRSVTDIGLSLGFSGSSAFYRAFVKSVGVTPEHFRQDSRY